jgi:hypothetical protein
MSAILGLIGSLSSVIRWGEPWDFESADDPLLERAVADDTAFWS